MAMGVWIDQLRYTWRRPSARVMGRWPDATQLLEFDNAVVRVRDMGRGPRTIVLTPDAPVVLENYDELMALLAPHARVVCFEFPGCGFSFPRFGFDFTLAAYVGTLGKVMDALGIARATLAFTCVNALVAMAYARQHPQRVERLALAQVADTAGMLEFARRIDLTVGGVAVLHTPILGQLFMIAMRKPIAHRWFRSALPKGSDIEPIWGPARRVFAGGGAFCLASLIQGQAKVTGDDFAVADIPATVVWGESDRTHRQTRKDSVLALLPQARLHRLAECGHCPDIESPRQYQRFLLDA
jgi:pimeloyl-ACP methyl ester carboxylesterase